MDPSFLQIILLGVIQGAAELLPVSSSAHVIVAEKLLGLDPATPTMTWLLVMLHTGTMLAVLVYFWDIWAAAFRQRFVTPARFAWILLLAALATAIVGFSLIAFAKKIFLHGVEHAEIEVLFGRLPLIATALLVTGIYILWSSGRRTAPTTTQINNRSAVTIGAVQGLCLPFRGLSRSGMTISTAMLSGIAHQQAESFSFALAVLITPVAIVHELNRFLRHSASASIHSNWNHLLAPSCIGFLTAFVSGLLALKLLSKVLEQGKWFWFGLYCLSFSAFVFVLSLVGF